MLNNHDGLAIVGLVEQCGHIVKKYDIRIHEQRPSGLRKMWNKESRNSKIRGARRIARNIID